MREEPRVGWIGLGKLGLPCALALEQYGRVEVVGYDTNPAVKDIITGAISPPNREQGLEDLIDGTRLELADSIAGVVAETDGIIFCAIQTPHAPEYGGEQPMPELTRDFDYGFLQAVAQEVSDAATAQYKDITLVVISTALPGTMRTRIMPLLNDQVTLVYNPFFIAMGTTIQDYLRPEFILLGSEKLGDVDPLVDLYTRLHGTRVPIREMSIESAELTKVAYNTFISMKIVFANTMMEICEAQGADVDEVTEALTMATDRVISPKYLRAGMGDGGACHPRDNIAMSWLAQTLGLSTDPFAYVTRAREAQSGWLAQRVMHEAENRGLPVRLLGKAYKPESDLVFGSPALLLANQLRTLGVEILHYDPYTDGPNSLTERYLTMAPAVFVVCTKHARYNDFTYPAGSAIIDPWRYITPRPGVEVVALGRGWRE